MPQWSQREGRFSFKPISVFLPGSRFWGGVLVFLLAAVTQAAPPETSDPARTSFTNLAALLLKSELGMASDRIQVYPTNEYRPAVHRLLQVAANVHDVASGGIGGPESVLPTIFKPVFAKENGVIFIVGFEKVVGNASNYLSPPLNLNDPVDREALMPGDNVFGIPWIIAARKGLPNFNELTSDTIFEISRILEMRKPAFGQPPSETNQLFAISLNSSVGVEAWNSYRNTFNRAVDIYCTNQMEVGLTLLNQPGKTGTNVQFTQLITPANGVFLIPSWIGTGTGTGSGVIPSRKSFAAVIATNSTLLTNGLFKADGVFTKQLTAALDWTTANQFPIPEIWISVTNRMQFVMVDRETRRFLDYVHLSVGDHASLSDLLVDPPGERGYRGLWITNRMGGDESNVSDPPAGVIEQISVALGLYGTPGNSWRDCGFGQATGITAEKQIDRFRSFLLGARSYFPPYAWNTNLVERVPFTPGRRIQFNSSWQANDPLIHQNDWELEHQKFWPGYIELPPSVFPQTLKNIGRLNDRYEPWGGNPNSSVDSSGLFSRRFDLRFKDPLVRSSDNWDFPKGDSLTPQSLGRIHRGTPWQTLYCKANELHSRDLRNWRVWTGINGDQDLVETLPQADWDVVALLVQYLWPEKPNTLLSINDTRQHQWLKTLDGIVALTNTVPDEMWINYNPTVYPEFEPWIISWKAQQAQQIVDGIESGRADTPYGYFENLGDIFQVKELSTKSPFLKLSDVQRRSGISDAAYETVALQLLTRLRPDSVGHFTNNNGRSHLRFSGIEGCFYRIETSTDLIQWKPVRTSRATTGCVEIELAVDAQEPQRFYRSVLLP